MNDGGRSAACANRAARVLLGASLGLLGACSGAGGGGDGTSSSSAGEPASAATDATAAPDAPENPPPAESPQEPEPAAPAPPVPEPEPPATEPPPDAKPAPAEPPPDAELPEVIIAVAEQPPRAGELVRLTWNAENAGACEADGGWSGERSTSGSALVGPLEAATTFTLSCAGPGGSTVEMLQVEVISPVTVRWIPPTANVDGSAIDDLAGFRIYYGEESRRYDQQVHVPDPERTSETVSLSSGTFFVAMTALDADGHESAYSNEVTVAAP